MADRVVPKKRIVIPVDAKEKPTTRRNIPAEAKESRESKRQAREHKERTNAQNEQTKATKKQTRATLKTNDGLDSLRSEFADMNRELAAIVQSKGTGIENQSKSEPKRGVQESFKDQKSFLKDLQKRLRQTQMQQGATLSDAAAEHLAGGGGVGGAIKAAAGLRVAQFKHKFDPLNIVKKLTGGSKLAVALAGKLTGRNEQSIRQFADLAPSEAGIPSSFFGRGKLSKEFGSPSRQHGGKGMGGDALPLLDKMSLTLSQMLKRLTTIENFEAMSVKIAKDHWDHVRDEAAEDKARFKNKSPAQQITKTEERPVKESPLSEMFSTVGNLLKSFAESLGGLLPTLASIGAGLTMFLLPLKSIIAALGKGLLSGIATTGSAVMKGGSSLLNGVKKMLGFGEKGAEAIAGKLAEAPTEKVAKKITLKATKSVAGVEKSLGAKLSESVVGKVASSSKVSGVLGSLVPKVAGKILGKALPGVGLALAANDLAQGNYVSGAINGIIGAASLVPGVGTGASVALAATGALTELVNSAYGDLYKDEKGEPMNPLTDPDRGPRLLALAKEASSALSEAFLNAPEQTPETSQMAQTGAPETTPSKNKEDITVPTVSATPVAPSEVPAPNPSTGMKLIGAADAQRNSILSPATSGGGATIINNVRNNNSNITNVSQGVSPARSEESSYLRSIDRSWAHS